MSLVLVDTNIILRGAQPGHPMNPDAINAQIELRRRGDQLCLVAQNLIEFRSVATRPAALNGLGMSQADADAEIARLKTLYPVLADIPTIFPEWERLVTTCGAAGKQNHDARIAAAMLAHGILTILTFNKADFLRYPGITALTPQEVLTPPPATPQT
jgi:predicted nucleic acid-binding protein